MRYLPPRAYLQYTTRQGLFIFLQLSLFYSPFSLHLRITKAQPDRSYFPFHLNFFFFFIPLLYSLLGVISSHHCQFGCTPKKEEELGLFYSYLIRFQRSTSWPTRFRLGRTQQLRRRLLVRWVTGSVLLLLLRLGVPASTFSSSLIPD